MSFNLNRRGFLQFAAGGTLGIATSGVTLHGLSEFNAALEAEQLRVPDGPESWAPSVCSMCPAGCGLRVRKIGKRAVKIQGNPLHPVNHGGLCPKGMAALQALYHPDRLKRPLKNTGTREKPRWAETSWDDAIGVVTSKLAELRDSGQAHTVALIDRNDRSVSSRLLRRFMTAYGSPNYLLMPSGMDAAQTAAYLQQGVTQPLAYDFENTRYLLSFGVNLLEGWGAPTAIMRAFGRWRDSSAGRRTKFVQAEPRFSVTAAKADEWISVRPGAEAALALGIAYVLITEGLYDATFVRERTFGFDDWRDSEGKSHLGFRSLVMSEYRLNDVAAQTGVPAETILRIAREFGQNRPALAIGDHQTSTLPGDPYASMAVHSLNALMGSIDVPGGVLVQAEPPGSSADVAAEKLTHPRIDAAPNHVFLRQGFSHLPQAITSRQPYPVQALILREANPVFSQPNGDAFRQAFRQVPFVVSFSSFLDESSAMADLVLPACTGLERWQATVSPPGFAYALQSISPPAVEARHGARDPADVVLTIARALGGPVAAALPFARLEEYLRSHVDELFKAQTGAVFATALEETWDRLLERSGWWAPTYSTADELWKQVKERGGWWEPTYYFGEWDRVVQTRSGKFEFYSQALADWAGTHPEFARAAGFSAADDHLCLPHQRPIADSSKEYPLVLLPVEVLPLAGGEGAHLPLLQQIAGVQLFEKWESWLEIQPETAHQLGIRDGDMVWVESRRGRARVRARHAPGTAPKVVHLPLGYGHTEGPEWACRGVNPLALVEERFDPVAGLPQTASTHVKVYRG